MQLAACLSAPTSLKLAQLQAWQVSSTCKPVLMPGLMTLSKHLARSASILTAPLHPRLILLHLCSFAILLPCLASCVAPPPISACYLYLGMLSLSRHAISKPGARQRDGQRAQRGTRGGSCGMPGFVRKAHALPATRNKQSERNGNVSGSKCCVGERGHL